MSSLPTSLCSDCKDDRDVFTPTPIPYLGCNTVCRPESFTAIPIEDITFCPCPTPPAEESNNCYWEVEYEDIYDAYLWSLSNKKHELEYPCHAEKNLWYEHRKFIRGDYPPVEVNIFDWYDKALSEGRE